MKIYAYFCGELDHQFTDTDDKQVEEMCRRLDDPDNDTQTYELEGGEPILFWAAGWAYPRQYPRP